MLTIACVEAGNYLGLGADYVARLKAGVARHLAQPFRFRCLTDDPDRHYALQRDEWHMIPRDLSGWWAKLHLFESFRFSDRVLYLDLDTVVVGDLTPLAASKGILDLTQWGWEKPSYGSGVMCWDGGEHREVFDSWTPEVAQRLAGDQDWLTELGGWQALPAGLCFSYRYHAKDAPPPGASVVCFHGRPKPHEVKEGWVPQLWR